MTEQCASGMDIATSTATLSLHTPTLGSIQLNPCGSLPIPATLRGSPLSGTATSGDPSWTNSQKCFLCIPTAAIFTPRHFHSTSRAVILPLHIGTKTTTPTRAWFEYGTRPLALLSLSSQDTQKQCGVFHSLRTAESYSPWLMICLCGSGIVGHGLGSKCAVSGTANLGFGIGCSVFGLTGSTWLPCLTQGWYDFGGQATASA